MSGNSLFTGEKGGCWDLVFEMFFLVFQEVGGVILEYGDLVF